MSNQSPYLPILASKGDRWTDQEGTCFVYDGTKWIGKLELASDHTGMPVYRRVEIVTGMPVTSKDRPVTDQENAW